MGNVGVRVQTAPYGTTGSYSLSQTSGVIVATGSAAAVIWSFQWASATHQAMIERVRVASSVVGTITTSVPYQLALFFNTAFTVAPSVSATAAVLTGRNCARQTSMPTTQLTNASILTTAAAGMTGQTLTADTQAIGAMVGASGTVIGNQFFGGMATLWDSNAQSGAHPLILAVNEGLTVTAPLAGPADGTFAVVVNIDWSEFVIGAFN